MKEDKTKGLFISGNKRSGSSQIVRLLNLHPNIFISHESDIIWILYQKSINKKLFDIYYPDSPLGMNFTINNCRDLIEKETSLQSLFYKILNRLMVLGTPWLNPYNKSNLLWIGDKKPFQYSDPSLVYFANNLIPGSVFIHLIRHPFYVATSAENFNKTPNGDFWKGMTLEASVEEWVKNEKNILELKKDKNLNIVDIKYEDLCKNTKNELSRLFNILDVPLDEKMLNKANRNTFYKIRKIPNIKCSEEAKSIMNIYGYKTDILEVDNVQIFKNNIYWFLKKKTSSILFFKKVFIFLKKFLEKIESIYFKITGKNIVHIIHIGKTGGTALKTAIENGMKDNKYKFKFHDHKFRLADVPVGERVVFFLRDPISRFVSGFYSRQRQGKPRHTAPWTSYEKYVFRMFNTPNELAVALSSENNEIRKTAISAMSNFSHFNSLMYWFTNEEYFKSRLDDILYFGFQENLSSDFEKLKNILGFDCSIELPVDDIGAHRNPKNLDTSLDQKAQENLLDYYIEDYKFINLCKNLKNKLF